jgi:RNA polymerase sigma factor (sigma-70 family)
MYNADYRYLDSWIRNKDASAFKELTEKYSALVYGACLRITRNPSDAEDLTQECFATLATIASIPRTPLGAWLHRVATNHSLQRIRAYKRRVNREESYVLENARNTEIEWKDINGMVDSAILELPEKLRIPIVAHFLNGESYTALAKKSGTSRQNVTYRVNKGIKLLRRSLKKRGVTVPLSALAAMMSTQIAEATAVPITTSAVLGKMALAGAMNSTSTAASSTAIGLGSGGINVLGGIVMTKSTIAGLGAAAAIFVGSATLYTIEHEPVAEKNTTELVTANLAAISRSNEISALEFASMAEEVDRYRKRVAELEAKLVLETPAAKLEEKTDQVSLSTMGSVRMFENKPEIPIEQTSQSRYNALFALLGLSADEQAQVRELFVNNLAELAADGITRNTLTSGTLDSTRLEKELSQWLSGEEMDLWRDYEEAPGYYHAQQGYNDELAKYAPGLTADSRMLIAKVLTEERMAFGEIEFQLGTRDNWERESEILDYAHERLVGAFEDREQRAFFNNYVVQQKNILQEQMDSAADGGGILWFEGLAVDFSSLEKDTGEWPDTSQ